MFRSRTAQTIFACPILYGDCGTRTKRFKKRVKFCQAGWLSAEFPSELQKTIREVAKNKIIHLSAEVQHCFAAISNWFNGCNDEIEAELEDEHDV